MTREEAIEYLSPIAESAALPRYKEALMLAISALKDQMPLETRKQAERNTVGERIKNARKHAKLTQSEVAERAGVHFAMIGAWERGERNPKIENLRKIAMAIGCELKELLDVETGDPEKGRL